MPSFLSLRGMVTVWLVGGLLLPSQWGFRVVPLPA